MPKKEKSIEEQIKEETAMLIDSFLRWEHIRTYGCQDPFYPDGENMNLIRNHIIYGKSRLEELCTNIICRYLRKLTQTIWLPTESITITG